MADDCLEVARWFEMGTNVEPVFDYDNGECQCYAIEDDGDVLHIIDVIERGPRGDCELTWYLPSFGPPFAYPAAPVCSMDSVVSALMHPDSPRELRCVC